MTDYYQQKGEGGRKLYPGESIQPFFRNTDIKIVANTSGMPEEPSGLK